ncbi:MAG: hypothetical protein E5V92_29325 [Mesorhizobium sp.]|uniref:hypothetical protein n=1 Tax=unclassified Mesorhizobium TaxID=325217 RepID=UPI000F761C9A|nr:MULTISPECIES: hypothetical protein [unclassified Mesorhizobium]AZO72615.1 hypothetical protein EJ067_16665 [Mesorhizobium sp. M1D.F.Ca.ET.043.01.1.1]RWA81245.1 MAG: hypothetical protein EOQ32_30400 [Mesorhizobium sp.]RWE05140.1 MAG: hypothetical protein EOS61_23665 [Mesorhizobium sp.]TJW76859.1 MAG: hypothetical protein E5V92_29325 [Mesorhizobium sp.]
MPKPFKEWKVLPHGRLTPVDDNILTVTGDIPMPVGNMTRRMTVVRLRDQRLVIFSAIALDDQQMRAIEAFGQPAFLIVPNDHHRLDAKPWKNRYPALQVIAPPGALNSVGKAVHVDATHGDFGDPDVKLIAVPGTRDREAALQVDGPNGTTLVLNDIVGNIRDASGFAGWALRMMGFAGDEPHIPLPVKLTMVTDKAALAAQFRRWAEQPALKRILVSHGSVITDDPQGALRKLATSLG